MQSGVRVLRLGRGDRVAGPDRPGLLTLPLPATAVGSSTTAAPGVYRIGCGAGIRPSVWWNARRNTARSVSAVRMAKGEYQGWPPRVVRGLTAHAAIASVVNQTVMLPR
jgi:hypothetical protein